MAEVLEPIEIRPATTADLEDIRALYNWAVRETTAIWNEIEVDLADRAAWLSARESAGFPVLVARRGATFLGYASYGAFRAFDGYRHTAEQSVYVSEAARGGGVGAALLGALQATARERGIHALVAGIEAGNAASIRLHEKLGFTVVGRMPEVGRKFGRWLDLVLMQRILS